MPDLLPDLLPKYMVTVGTRWYLLGLAAAPLYQRVPIVTNSHKHNQDSNSLGGTIKPQVRGRVLPDFEREIGHQIVPFARHAEDKAAAQGMCRFPFVAEKHSLLSSEATRSHHSCGIASRLDCQSLPCRC